MSSEVITDPASYGPSEDDGATVKSLDEAVDFSAIDADAASELPLQEGTLIRTAAERSALRAKVLAAVAASRPPVSDRLFYSSHHMPFGNTSRIIE